MATTRPDAGVADQRSSSGNKSIEWADVVPKNVSSEDALSPAEVKVVWEKLYAQAGCSTANEQERMAVRAGVYVYAALNGTSREGDYKGKIQLSNGKTIDASVIPIAVGKFRIRKFFRGNMKESYTFFKDTRFMESEDRFVAKVASLGISADCAFATADWLTDCPYFTPTEARAHNVSFNRGIERAKRSRDGNTLETVESSRVDDTLKVQGPLEAKSGEPFNF